MSPIEQRDLVQRLVDHPYDHSVLSEIHAETAEDPRRYASLLQEAARVSERPDAASHWLTEAALVHLTTLEDPGEGRALLRRAIERDPMNLRAAETLTDVCRDPTVVELLEQRARALESLCESDRTLCPRAADAYEALGVHLAERVGDPGAAVVALRRALTLLRTGPDRHAASLPAPRRLETLAPPNSAVVSRRPQSPPPPPSARRDTTPARSGPPPSADGRGLSPSVPTQIDELSPSMSPESAPTERMNQKRHLEGENPAGSEDRLIGLFEALHAVRLCHDAMEAAALVVQIARDALDAAAGMVHLYDVVSREYVVSAALGSHHRNVIGLRTPEGDPLLEKATRLTSTVCANRPFDDALLRGARWRVLDARHSVLCAPAQLDGVIYGAIELIDPMGRAEFDGRDKDALTYVGERIAEFLVEYAPVLG